MLFLKIFDDKDKELELLDDYYKSSIPEKISFWRPGGVSDTGQGVEDYGFPGIEVEKMAKLPIYADPRVE